MCVNKSSPNPKTHTSHANALEIGSQPCPTCLEGIGDGELKLLHLIQGPLCAHTLQGGPGVDLCVWGGGEHHTRAISLDLCGGRGITQGRSV